MTLTRRTVLAQGLAGLAWGLTPVRPALAAPAPRRLALLVGLNRVNRTDVPPLLGCHSDLALVRQLLVEGCGFQPNDILFLTDAQATRLAIESAFLGHLGQAGPADCVYFHFSGYGRMLPGPDGGLLEPALVTADSRDDDLNDLPLSLLWLLFRSLRTERAIASLDTGFARRTDLPPELRQRGLLPGRGDWSEELRLARQRLLNRTGNRAAAATGAPVPVLWAAATDQPALELRWDGLDAGLFTAALCQQAWARGLGPAQLRAWRNATALAMGRLLGLMQQPQALARGKPQPAFGAPPACDAWRLEEAGKSHRLWLGGLPADQLALQGRGSRFSARLTLRSRQGYWGQVAASDAAPQALTEQQRCQLPEAGLQLLAVERLPRIERVELANVLATLPERISLLDGPGPWDLLVDRSGDGRYRLVSRGLGILAEGLDLTDLGVFLAQRSPDLLLHRTLRQLQNDSAGALPLKVVLQPGLTGGLVGSSGPRTAREDCGVLPILAPGTPLQLRLENPGLLPVHWLLLGFDGTGRCLWRSLPRRDLDPQLLASAQVLDLGDEEWRLDRTGLGSVWVLAADRPLAEVETLAEDADGAALATALLADLGIASGRSRCFDLGRYAALSLLWRSAR